MGLPNQPQALPGNDSEKWNDLSGQAVLVKQVIDRLATLKVNRALVDGRSNDGAWTN